MKQYWSIAVVAVVGLQITMLSVRAEETNTLEIIKQLQKRIEELEQKVKVLESNKERDEQVSEGKTKQRIEALDQQLKSLERKR